MNQLCSLLLVCLLGITNLPAQQTQKQYLSGTGSDQTVDWEFFCTKGQNAGKWTTIPVPSCWELQGFGSYNYGHVPMEERLNEEGLYKYQFRVNPGWKGQRIRIVFEGVMTDAEVKINGHLAGPVHQGAFYEFAYDLTEIIRFDAPNLLEVTVKKHSANASINQAERKADFWIFGGIFRPVYLEAKPQDHIERVAVDAKQQGNLTADVFLHSAKAKQLKVDIRSLQGELINSKTFSIGSLKTGKTNIQMQVPGIKAWTPESPNLYQATFSLLDEKQGVLHQHQERIGFRTVEIREKDGIYVNGVRIKFKGVNRHSFWPTTGRTLNKQQSIEDVLLMKDMNMNAVRMSHYPPDKHFLDACDSLGLFVLDELAGWQRPAYDREIGRKLLKEMVIRDVNHPSIVIWDNGNEGGWNTELDEDFAQWDIQKREVIHPWGVFNKTSTFHYFQYNYLAFDSYHQDKIFFPTELLHGLYDGGLGAGLDDYWKLMWENPLCAGGFLWVFADEGVVRTDKNGELDFDGNHTPDGILGPYHEKEGSYYTIKEIWSPVQLEKRFITKDFNGVFKIENRYHYTNLNQCQIVAKWVAFEGPDAPGKVLSQKQQTVKSPDLAPQQSGTLAIDLPEDWPIYDALYLTIIDPAGQELFTWSYPIKSPEVLNPKWVNKRGKSGSIEVQVQDNTLILSHKKLQLKFNTTNGLLQEVRQGQELLPIHSGPVILSEKDSLPTSVEHHKTAAGYEVVATYASGNQFNWTLQEDGVLDLKTQIRSRITIDGVEGITFSMSEADIQSKKWLGDGPYRVWRNRMKGTRFGIWENDYNNSITGESGFIYPEFKGFFSNVYWVQINPDQSRSFTIYNHSPFTYLRCLNPDQPAAPGKAATVDPYPTGNLSFLKTIPAIGTKFSPAEALGPQSQNQTTVGRDPEPLVIHLSFDFRE